MWCLWKDTEESWTSPGKDVGKKGSLPHLLHPLFLVLNLTEPPVTSGILERCWSLVWVLDFVQIPIKSVSFFKMPVVKVLNSVELRGWATESQNIFKSVIDFCLEHSAIPVSSASWTVDWTCYLRLWCLSSVLPAPTSSKVSPGWNYEESGVPLVTQQ